MKLHREQFIECRESGLTTETEFFSFEDHPEMMPAFPNQKMTEMINSGEWNGINLIKCGRFGGICSGGHEKCKELRGYNVSR